MTPTSDQTDLTEDAFLGGAVMARQPAKGFRAAMDTVLLAAAVPALSSGRVVELGCGAGIASLCYAERCAGADILGIDADPQIIALAQTNAALNNKEARVRFQEGRVGAALDIAPNSADQVFANPPYLAEGSAARSPDAHRDRSMVEAGACLADWINAMLKVARQKGGITLVHRADRLQEILALLEGQAGETAVLPLWPRTGTAAKRVIVHARKAVRGGTRMLPGLTLHGNLDGERYTPEAEAILRDGAALPLR